MSFYLCGPTGGTGGNEFQDSSLPQAPYMVAEVRVWSGEMVDGMQFVYTVGGAVVELPHRGGQGGVEQTMPVPPGWWISRMGGRYGDTVDNVSIVVTDGNEEKWQSFGGGGGGGWFVYDAPPGFEIVGLFGRADELIDAIGVVFRPLSERAQA